MTPNDMRAKARQVILAKLQARRYIVTWRSNSARLEFVGMQGFNSLAEAIGVSPSSLYNYISRGKGSCSRQMTNPTTGEPDIATITKVDVPAKHKSKRGRPPKQLNDERLGTEFAESARTVPKTRNRRTDEKP